MDARPGAGAAAAPGTSTWPRCSTTASSMLGAEIRARDAHVDIDAMPVVDGRPGAAHRRVRQPALQRAPVRPARAAARSRSRPSAPRPAGRSRSRAPARRSPSATASASSSRGSAAAGERRARGVGLGLAIVRQVVERHGGQVGVTSPSDATQPLLLHAAGLSERSGRRLAAHPLGDRDGLLARAGVELAQDVLDVRAHGLGREHELSAIWSVVLALGEQVDDLPLARRQRRLDRAQAAGARPARGAAARRAACSAGARSPPRRSSAPCSACGQHVDVDVLGEEAGRAGAQPEQADLVVVGGREDDDDLLAGSP